MSLRTQSMMLWTTSKMLKAHVPLLQGLQTQIRVITVPTEGKTAEKARARAKEKTKAQGILKSDCAPIVTSITLQKLGTVVTADPDQMKNINLIPTRCNDSNRQSICKIHCDDGRTINGRTLMRKRAQE